MLTADEIACLVAEFYEAELDRDFTKRLEKIDAHDAQIRKKYHAWLLGDLREQLARGEFALIRNKAERLIKKSRLPIARDSREYKRLCHFVQRGWIEVFQRRIERDDGDFGGTPSDPVLRSHGIQLRDAAPQPAVSVLPAAPTVNPLGTRPMSILVGRLLNEKQGLAPTTVGKYRAAATLFDQLLGSKPANSVRRQDIVDFKDLLARLPVNWSKRFPGMSAREAIEENEKQRLPTLAPRNVNDSYLTYVNAFFKWAATNNIRPDNPATGIAMMMPKGFNKKARRDPFTVAQLRTIFNAPIFTGCSGLGRPYSPGSFLIRDHRFWVPLVALFSGARLNELGQCDSHDIENIGGIWCLRITTQSDAEEGDNAKRLKTTASKRIVPIHPELQTLGFLAYAEMRRTKGDKRLFPDWSRGKDGTYSSVFSKSFNSQFLPRLGIKTPKLVFHSFRHAFVDAMRDAGIEEAIQKALVGHSDQSTTAIYGTGHRVQQLAGAIERIRYGGLDLAHLKQHSAPIQNVAA